MRDSIIPMCSAFRLFAASKGVADADGCMGCAVQLFERSALANWEELSASTQELMASALFHAINWFREAISAFASAAPEDFASKLITRVSNIIELECHLKTLLIRVRLLVRAAFVLVANCSHRVLIVMAECEFRAIRCRSTDQHCGR